MCNLVTDLEPKGFCLNSAFTHSGTYACSQLVAANYKKEWERF